MGKQIYLSNLTKRLRVALEESWQGETAKNPERRWLQVIPCQGFKAHPQEGPFISLFSEDPPTLKLYTPRPRNAQAIWERIKDKPGCRADFHMDGEAELFFPPECLDVVAEGAGARVKRQGRPMTPEQKAKLAEMGREALKKLREATSQTHKIDPNLNDIPAAMV